MYWLSTCRRQRRFYTGMGFCGRSYILTRLLYGGFVTYVILLGISLDGQTFIKDPTNRAGHGLEGVTSNWSQGRASRQWQYVTPGGDILVYSAYYLQDEFFGGRREIRVVAAVDSQGGIGKRISRAGIRCLYLYIYDAQEEKRIANATRVYILPDHHDTRFRPAVITCPVTELHQSLPAVLSVVTRTFSQLPPFNHLPVYYNTLSPMPSRHFTMCLSPLHGIVQTPADLVQYFELNRLLGAEFFVIYNYTLGNPVNNAIINYYVKQGLAEVVAWNLPRYIRHPDGIWYYAQVAMLTDCMLRNRGVSRRVITTDLDEFIIPLTGMRWVDALENEPVSCEYSFKSVAFTDDISSGNDLRLSTQIRLTRSVDVLHDRYRTKYIVDPKCVETPGIHFSMNITTPSNMAAVTNVSSHKALAYHYNSRLTKGESFHDVRMTKYELDLNKNVRHVLNKVFSKNAGIRIRHK